MSNPCKAPKTLLVGTTPYSSLTQAIIVAYKINIVGNWQKVKCFALLLNLKFLIHALNNICGFLQ